MTKITETNIETERVVVCIVNDVFTDPSPAQARGRPKYSTYQNFKGRKSSSLMNLYGKIEKPIFPVTFFLSHTHKYKKLDVLNGRGAWWSIIYFIIQLFTLSLLFLPLPILF